MGAEKPQQLGIVSTALVLATWGLFVAALVKYLFKL